MNPRTEPYYVFVEGGVNSESKMKGKSIPNIHFSMNLSDEEIATVLFTAGSIVVRKSGDDLDVARILRRVQESGDF